MDGSFTMTIAEAGQKIATDSRQYQVDGEVGRFYNKGDLLNDD
jgi:hypothetical protein